MKNSVIVGILCATVGLGAGWLLFRAAPESGGGAADRTILYYRNPMNPRDTSAVPKKAPDGMDFVPVYADAAPAKSGKKILYWHDPMHPWYTSDKPGKAPDCGMDLVPVYEGENDAKGIRIDPTVVQNIGVKTEEVAVRKLTRTIRTSGEIAANETRVFSINAKIGGWVEKLHVNYTGMPVRRGEPLLDLYSPELVSTQEEYLQALRYRDRLAGPGADEARAGGASLVESARRRLRYWDIPEADIDALEARGTPKKTMTIYAPVDGYVLAKSVFEGQQVAPGAELFRIADLSTVWILADIYQDELPWVRVGQKAGVILSYLPGKTFAGRVAYVYPTLDTESKTAKVRIEVRNTSALECKPGMFATVEIASPLEAQAVAVPEQAVIRTGERNVVVVALGGGSFDPRNVTLGVTADGYVQILDGVKPGEKIVVSSQFLIDSESNLKAAIAQMRGANASSGAEDGHTGGRTAGARMTMDAAGTSAEVDGGSTRRKEAPHAPPKPDRSRPGHKPAQSVTDVLTDPVCGMVGGSGPKLTAVFRGKRYHFCSEDDKETFLRDPEKYAK